MHMQHFWNQLGKNSDSKMYKAKIFQLGRLRAGFTQKGKLVWGRNSVKAPMGVESSDNAQNKEKHSQW